MLPPSAFQWSFDVGILAEAIQVLERHGWPATFVAVYDETWQLAQDASQVMKHATGNVMSMDIVALCVDLARGAKGFSPHRDRQPEDWKPRGIPEAEEGTFKSDGMAKYVTIWIALTDANPDNSCLYFVPRLSDPGYVAGDTEDGDPLARCFQKARSISTLVCVPVPEGGASFHTHRTLHWGSCGRKLQEGEQLKPRIALSLGFSSSDFEPPYF